MKAFRIYPLLLLFLLARPSFLEGQSIRLGQVDPNRLLTHQEVDLYLGLTDSTGEVPTSVSLDQFLVEESIDGESFQDVPALSIRPVSELDAGITFLLLVDNSGSMYQTLTGADTEDPSAMRITAAKSAIRTFLSQLDTPANRVALASFNTSYHLHSPPTANTEEIDRVLDEITEPEPRAAYTELYRGIFQAAGELENVVGRRVIVVLSDGENFPYSIHADEPHPVYGDDLVTPEGAVDSVIRQSAGVFAINFATTGDQELVSIVNQTGGLLFDARNEVELASVYQEIQNRIVDEYQLTYRPEVRPGSRRFVRVTYLEDARLRVQRRYFTATILGAPGTAAWQLYLIPLILGLLLAVLVALLRFRNRKTTPNLEVLTPRGKATQLLDITATKTVIGSSTEADLTIANAPSLKESHATIVFDKTTKSYTVVSDDPINVNNHRTSKRRLEPGDVIQLPGSTIVFDAPEEEES